MKNAKLVTILAITMALGALLIQNRAPVQTRFLMLTVEMPQILLLVLAVGGGFALGLLTALTRFSKSTPKP